MGVVAPLKFQFEPLQRPLNLDMVRSSIGSFSQQEMHP
jgi:hypothetical protein